MSTASDTLIRIISPMPVSSYAWMSRSGIPFMVAMAVAARNVTLQVTNLIDLAYCTGCLEKTPKDLLEQIVATQKLLAPPKVKKTTRLYP